MKEIIVNQKYDKKKLSKFIFDNFPNLSSNIFYKALRQKDFKINNVRTNKDLNINENDIIQIYISDQFLFSVPKLNIVFEDENILIINKPANIEVTGENSLSDIISKTYSNSSFIPKPCHRLDRNTTGLILFAKNQESLDILFDKFKNHEIEKRYHALVYGIPKENSKRMESYLFKDNKKSLVYIQDEPKKGYLKIITSYKIIEKYKNNSCLLDVNIETGRTHQIRAHLAHIGYPIIGDGKYGNNDINKKFGFKYQQLNSYKLKFNFSTDSGILNYLKGKTYNI